MATGISMNFYYAYKKIQMLFQSLSMQIGIDTAPYAALIQLWEKDGLTISELGDVLQLKSSTITSLTDRMERDGLVTRERMKDDRRVVKIFLTEKARQLRGVYPTYEDYLMSKINKHFSPEELELLNKLLKKIDHSLTEELKEQF